MVNVELGVLPFLATSLLSDDSAMAVGAGQKRTESKPGTCPQHGSHSPQLARSWAPLAMDGASVAGTAASQRGLAFESELTYLRHCDMPASLHVTLRVQAMQGTVHEHSLTELLDAPHLKHAGNNQQTPSDLYVVASLYANGNRLVHPVQTAHKAFKSKQSYAWNETLTMPIKYRDLTLDAQLALTVVDIAAPRQRQIVGGTTMRLFGKKHTLRNGKQRLYLWRGKHADGATTSNTPSKFVSHSATSSGGGPPDDDEMGRLEKLVKHHERGDVTRLDWLDKLAFRQIEKIHAVGAFLRQPKQRKQLMFVRNIGASGRVEKVQASVPLPRHARF